MARRGLVYVGVAVGALVASGRAGATVTVTSFPPSSWGASNAALGFTNNAIVEDFEDTTLVAGLAYRITGQPMTAPATALPNTFVPSTDPNGKAFAQSVWDGTHVFINTADNLSKRYADVPSWGGVRFAFPEGVTRVGFSLTDLQGYDRLIVNGDMKGSIGSEPGTTNIQLGSGIRNGYLVIAAGPGERVFDVSIDSDFNGDGYAIDHMLIERPAAASAVVFLSDDLAGAVYRYRLTAGGAPVLEATIPSPSAKGFAFRNGEMLVGDYAGGAISRFLSPFGTPRANGRITGVGLMLPEQMTFVNDELWVLNSNTNTPTATAPLVRLGFDGQGNASMLGTITDGLVGANRGIVWNPAYRELLVSQCCTVRAIQQYTVGPTDAGAPGVTRQQGATLTGTQNPHGMAMAQWHELFVASLDNTILRYTFEDGMLPGTPIRGADFRSPVGVAFTPWGELLVANQADGTVARVTFDGARAPILGGTFQTPASAASRLGWIAVQALAAGCAPPTAPACQTPPNPDAGGGGSDAGTDGGSDGGGVIDAAPGEDARDAGGSGDAHDAAADRAPDAGRGGSGGGCGCRTSGAEGSGAAGIFVLASLVLAARRRRR